MSQNQGTTRRALLTVAAGAATAAATGAGALSLSIPPGPRLDPAGRAALAERLQADLKAALQDHAQPSLSLAVFDREGVLWSGAAGFADADQTRAADRGTLYRAGSISKLFTDVMIMQLVAAGKLDLDAPARTYLGDFAPKNPFGGEITLRQLMSHRSGLVREPPVGSYFEMGDPGSAALVASLNRTTLVAAPGSVTKYSNAGLAVLGRIVEVVTGQDYDTAVKARLLSPLGMADSGFTLPSGDRLAYAEMAPFDAPRFPAPRFDIGLKAAGGLVTHPDDLSRFGRMVLNGGALEGATVLPPTLFAQMLDRQFGGPGAVYGLGFHVGRRQGRRYVGHAGGIYGYISSLKLYLDEGLGVAVMGAVDGAEDPLVLDDHAIDVVRALMRRRPAPAWRAASTPVEEAASRKLEGTYALKGRSVVIRRIDAALLMETPTAAGEIRVRDGKLFFDCGLAASAPFSCDPDGAWVALGAERFRRTVPPRPAPPEPALAELIGEYGWDHEYVRVYERDGGAHLNIEWIDYGPVRLQGRDALVFGQDSLLYPRESLTVVRDAGGAVRGLSLNGFLFPRKTIAPVKPPLQNAPARRAQVAAGLAAARTQSPPAETGDFLPNDLVPLTSVDPTIMLDIRYATDNNFTGVAVYEKPVGLMQRPAAQALARAHRRLGADGLGIVLFDGYRPWSVTKMFWDITPEAGRIFVADPSKGSRHNRGCAADIGLVDRATGEELEFTGQYDESSTRSFAAYIGGSELERWRRDRLRAAMEAEGFYVYRWEWWHFDFRDWRRYRINNTRLDQ